MIGQAKHRDPFAALLPDPSIVPYGDADAARAAIDDETAAFIVDLGGDDIYACPVAAADSLTPGTYSPLSAWNMAHNCTNVR